MNIPFDPVPVVEDSCTVCRRLDGTLLANPHPKFEALVQQAHIDPNLIEVDLNQVFPILKDTMRSRS